MQSWGWFAGLAAFVAAGAWGCAKTPESGRYCRSDDPSDCIWIDLDHSLVTYYDDGRPTDVRFDEVGDALETHPTLGKYAGKTVRLTFDASDRSKVELSAVGATTEENLAAKFERVKK
jgi:hypothetical protein